MRVDDRTALTLQAVAPFLSQAQMQTMLASSSGEEAAYFRAKLVELSALISAMPVTYANAGQGAEAIAYLHYFARDCDWYITEKDRDGGVLQAYGYAVLNGDLTYAEFGYISIAELVAVGAELDLHFEPASVAVCLAQRFG